MNSRDRPPAGDDAGPASADPVSDDPTSDDPTSDDDARLWESVTRSVKPIVRKDIAPEAAPPAPDRALPERPTPERGPESDRKPPGVSSGAPSSRERVNIDTLKMGAQDRPARDRRAQTAVSRPGSGGLSYGDAPGVDRRTATRFRRGLMPIDARLDLHGHTQQSGRTALTGFLQAHRAAGRRCVLVVTGKGLKDDWSVGALRQALPGWLNAPDLRRLILAYCHAQPHHGGSGAVYILLKRERGSGGREGG